MIRPPSNQHPYDEFWSGDPAFVQPPAKPVDGAPPEALKAYDAAFAEHYRKVRNAREAGNWSELVVEGSLPTRFVVKPMPGHVYRAILMGLASGKLDHYTLTPIAFRACIVKIENGGLDKIATTETDEYGQIASLAVTDYLDGITPFIVSEIGAVLYSRGTQGLSPKR